MGFLKSFFGAMAAAEISEKKREAQEQERETKASISNVDKILNYESSFIKWLWEINCKNPDYDELISDYQIENGYVSANDVWQAKCTIDEYKRKMKEFMCLGGNPFFVYDLRKLDLYIEIVRRLKEYGWLDKQEQYVKRAVSTLILDYDWQQEQQERHKYNVQISALLNTATNEIKEIIKSGDSQFVPYESHQDAIVIDIAKSKDETKDNFLEFLTVSLAFTDEYIIVYNGEHNEMYYKASVKWKDVDVEWTGVTFRDWSLVKINGLPLLFNTEKAKEVVSFYGSHNVRVAKSFSDQYNAAYENINSLTGVEFELVCKRLLENMGFEVETTKTTGDGGIDLIAYNHQPLLHV